MNLTLIPHQTCPTCGSRTVAESCRSVHIVNKQGFEERTFECGARWRWSPDGERLENPDGCPAAPAEVLKRTKRDAAACVYLTAILAADVDEEFRYAVVMDHPWRFFHLPDARRLVDEYRARRRRAEDDLAR